MKQAIPLFPQGLQGLSDSKWSGTAGSAHRIVGIDYRQTPGIIQAQQALVKDSGTTITEQCNEPVKCSDGSILWFSSESGKIWREVGGVYTLIYTTVLEAGDVRNSAWSGESYDTNAGGGIRGMNISASGTKLLVNTGRYVREYTLSTAWDISTGTYVTQFDTETQTDGRMLQKNFLRADGLRYYATSSHNTGIIVQYNMSTANSVSTMSYGSATFVHGKGGCSVQFKSDGTKMYLMELSGVVYEYTLGTAWDISTATLTNTTTALPTLAGFPTATSMYSFYLNADGTRMYALSGANYSSHGGLYEFTMSTPFDTTTLAYLRRIRREDGDIFETGLEFKPDISKWYAFEFNSEVIYEFDIPDYSVYTDVKTYGAIEYTKQNDSGDYVPHIYWATKDVLLTIPTADIGGNWNDRFAQGLFENGETNHPMCVQQEKLFIGDGKDMAIVNNSIFSPTSNFALISPEKITVLGTFDIDILVGTLKVDKARVLRWDGDSTSYSASDDIDEKGVNAFIKDDNFVYASIGEYGRLYYYDGEKMEPHKRIAGDWSPSKTATVHRTSVGFLLGVPVFGVSNVAGNPVLQGVYGFGSYSRDYAKTLSLDFPIGSFEGLTIGGIVTDGANMWVSYKTASDVGIAKLSYTTKYNGGYIETTVLKSPKERSDISTITNLFIDYVSLPTNTGVAVGVKTKYDTNYTTLTTANDRIRMQLRADHSIPQIVNLQIKYTITTSGNDTPQIENFSML